MTLTRAETNQLGMWLSPANLNAHRAATTDTGIFTRVMSPVLIPGPGSAFASLSAGDLGAGHVVISSVAAAGGISGAQTGVPTSSVVSYISPLLARPAARISRQPTACKAENPGRPGQQPAALTLRHPVTSNAWVGCRACLGAIGAAVVWRTRRVAGSLKLDGFMAAFLPSARFRGRFKMPLALIRCESHDIRFRAQRPPWVYGSTGLAALHAIFPGDFQNIPVHRY